MTDLEMTRLCAEAMGYKGEGISDHWGGFPIFASEVGPYDPIHDDAQAMALLKKFALTITPDDGGYLVYPDDESYFVENSRDLNRAIVECVAKMQKAKNAVAE